MSRVWRWREAGEIYRVVKGIGRVVGWRGKRGIREEFVCHGGDAYH